MVVSPVASHVVEKIFAPYDLVAEIGSRPSPLYVVRQSVPAGKPKLLVAERFVGAVKQSTGLSFMNVARRISTLASPNLARVRDVSPRGDDLVVFWDFIDGDKLEKIWLSAGVPLDVAVRVILDVLSGVGAIHGLRDAKQQPMHLAHGEISAATIILGVDGVARVMHAIAKQLPEARAEEASLGYLAPEVHTRTAYDARADVFSAGVLLWEALSGARLFATSDGVAIVERVRGGVATASVSDGAPPWAKGLVQVAAKALAPWPDDRWATAAAMANEIRKVVGLKLAPAMAAATFAKGAIGKRASARREKFESAGAERSAVAPQPSRPETVVVRVAAVSPPPPPPVAARGLETDTDVELVADSIPPSALEFSPPERIGRLADALVPSPPPLPMRAVQPSRPDPVAASPPTVDDTRIASEPQPYRPQEEHASPYFDAAIDVPISILPPPTDPYQVSPTTIEPPPAVEDHPPVNWRIRGAVLGGVATLGLVVFVLVGWRFVHPGAQAMRPRAEHSAQAPVDVAPALSAGVADDSLPIRRAAPTAPPTASETAPAPPTATPTTPRSTRAISAPIVAAAPTSKAAARTPTPKPSAPSRAVAKPPAATSSYHPTSL